MPEDERLLHTVHTVAFINLEMRATIRRAHSPDERLRREALAAANAPGGFWTQHRHDGRTGPLWSRYLPVHDDDWMKRGRRVLAAISEHGRLAAADRMVIGHTIIDETVTAWCVSSYGYLTKPSPSKPCPASGGFSRLISIDVGMSKHIEPGRRMHPSDALMILGREGLHQPASGLDLEEEGSKHAQLYHLSPPVRGADADAPAKIIPLRFS